MSQQALAPGHTAQLMARAAAPLLAFAAHVNEWDATHVRISGAGVRVAEYDRYGPPEVIVVRERADPVPGPGEVLIRVHAAALNPKDLLIRAGKYPLFVGPRFPKRVGYDWAGEVVLLGRGVTRVRLGEHTLGMIQAWAAGACATHLVAREDELCTKPSQLSWEDAAALPLVSLTALQALRDHGRLRPGQRVLINGASGGVGVSAVQIAKALGAHVSTRTSASNRAFVQGLGADDTFDYATHDIAQAGQRYDVILDAFGNQSFASTRAALTEHGTYVTTVPTAGVIARQVLGAWSSQRARLVVVRSRARDLEFLAQLVHAGTLQAVVEQTYSLDQLPEAQRKLASKRTRGKLVVRILGADL